MKKPDANDLQEMEHDFHELEKQHRDTLNANPDLIRDIRKLREKIWKRFEKVSERRPDGHFDANGDLAP